MITLLSTFIKAEEIGNWTGALAIAGVAVPFDELIDVFRRALEIKAVWKTVKEQKRLVKAWNC